MGSVSDLRAHFQRDKDIALPGHDHAKTPCLKQRAKQPPQIQRVILFVTITANRTFIETAMTGIEHDRLHAAEIFDHVRPQLRLECFCQVDAGNKNLSLVDEHGKAQPIPHAIEQHLAAIDAKLQFVFLGAELDILAINYGTGETVELREVVDAEEIAPIDLDDLPFYSRDQPAGQNQATDRAYSKAAQVHHSEKGAG